ncbi:unnamed protein product [Adineta steineri]|uniref:U-box domain-containing protein n=1 Tax=Adineta steineri TaxID=433720 RepID=A0A819KY09_9BILA|nr:unnamed protein product [Adineta steineri]CAF3956051.1 unnamed protein product [Adineta steineri]
MLRRTKQMLAMDARQMANSDSFVPVLLLSEENVEQCSQEQFLKIIANFDELCANRSIEERSQYVEQVYHRMLKILSQKTLIPLDHIIAVIKQFIIYYPSMAILTLDELKTIGIEMERRSIIIHFDMSGSMSGSGFAPLVRTVTNFCANLQTQGITIYVSLFGGNVQENVHNVINNRLLTLDEFIKGNYQPNGGTAFCPSFERTKQFASAYDAIIISDGEFTDDISRLTFQEQCKTVFFVAPPWSPKGVEQKHATAISSCVHANVPYIGIASEQYSQLDTIIEGFIRDHHSFVNLIGYTAVGTYILPSHILAPTQMVRVFNDCSSQGEQILQIFIKKLLGLFRYLEETAKLNFERCLRGIEFQSIMSLITPLTKTSYSHLETSISCQQLYGYLSKILNTFTNEKQKLIYQLAGDIKSKQEINTFWDNAMSFSERSLIIEDNEKKYGSCIGYLDFQVDNLTCTSEILLDALQQLKTIYSPENLDYLSLILDILSSCKINQQPTPGPENSHIPIWKKSDGTIELLSILRMLPSCLQQFQYSRKIPLDNDWTLQPLAASRLAWVMAASGRIFPDFITNALPSLVVPNTILTDLNIDENRSAFWMKIIRELASKLDVPPEILQTIHQILTVHNLKGFLLRLTDGSVTYEKQIYENVSPFIDTGEPSAWCIFVDENGNRVDASTGKTIAPTAFVTDPDTVARWYSTNFFMRGAVVRPRYLTLLEHPDLPEGTIELYQTSGKKDVDILRDQLIELSKGSLSSDQINAHIYTIRDRLKSIPCIVWGSNDKIGETIIMAKTACHGASLPTEKVVINISRSVIIDYLTAHCNDAFIAGALRAFSEYSRVAKEQALAGISEVDHVIECGQKTTTIPNYETMRFIHFDKPGVREYLENLQKKFIRSLRSVLTPPQFSSLSTLFKQIESTKPTDEIVSIADLELIPTQAVTTNSTQSSSRTILDQNFFTCPITLDIMDNPVTLAPCGHMFEMDAIVAYLNTAGNTCPICRSAVTNVSPNHTFKNVIEAWVAQQTI